MTVAVTRVAVAMMFAPVVMPVALDDEGAVGSAVVANRYYTCPYSLEKKAGNSRKRVNLRT